MKINPIGGPDYIQGNSRSRKIDAYRASQLPPSRDEATLSEDAISFSKVFTEAKQAMGPEGTDRPDRVAELKVQVAEGTYHIDSEQIAESILGDLYG